MTIATSTPTWKRRSSSCAPARRSPPWGRRPFRESSGRRGERTLLGRPRLRSTDYFPGSIVFKALQGGKFPLRFYAPGRPRLLGADIRTRPSIGRGREIANGCNNLLYYKYNSI